MWFWWKFIYLAEKGFRCECVDLSSVAINVLKEKAKKGKLEIKAEIGDVASYSFKKSYDSILCFRTFQYLEWEVGMDLIKKMQKHTNLGGVNLIDGFLDVPPFSEMEPTRCSFKEEELQRLYSSWKILVYNEDLYETPKKDNSGNPLFQRRVFFAAKKI